MREKWKIIDTIQSDNVKKLFKKNEAIKIKLEEKSLLDKNKVEIINNDRQAPLVTKPKIVPISPDLEDYSLLDKNKVEILQPQEVTKSTEEIMNNFLYTENE